MFAGFGDMVPPAPTTHAGAGSWSPLLFSMMIVALVVAIWAYKRLAEVEQDDGEGW